MFPREFAWGAATAAYQIEGKLALGDVKHKLYEVLVIR